MTRMRLILAGSAVAALVAAFAAGRYSAPAKVVTRTETVTVERRVEVVAKADATATHAQTQQAVHWRERIVYRPGGITEVVRETERRATRETDSSAVHAEQHATTQESARVEVREKIVTAPRPEWSVGVNYGRGLDGRTRYGAEVDRRLFGTMWLQLQADVPSRSAVVGLRMEF